jgi:hypothetical protein
MLQTTGGVEGFTLHKKTNPALVLPDGQAGAANIEPSPTTEWRSDAA